MKTESEMVVDSDWPASIMNVVLMKHYNLILIYIKKVMTVVFASSTLLKLEIIFKTYQEIRKFQVESLMMNIQEV